MTLVDVSADLCTDQTDRKGCADGEGETWHPVWKAQDERRTGPPSTETKGEVGVKGVSDTEAALM